MLRPDISEIVKSNTEAISSAIHEATLKKQREREREREKADSAPVRFH